jgi:hypothetical protein
VPAHGFDRLGLSEAFQETDPVTVGIQAIHIVQDDRLVSVSPQVAVNAKSRCVTVDPTGMVADSLPHDSAFSQARAADENQEVEKAVRKSADKEI